MSAIIFVASLHILQFAVAIIVLVQANGITDISSCTDKDTCLAAARGAVRVPATIGVLLFCFSTALLLIVALVKYRKDRREALSVDPLTAIPTSSIEGGAEL